MLHKSTQATDIFSPDKQNEFTHYFKFSIELLQNLVYKFWGNAEIKFNFQQSIFYPFFTIAITI